MGESWIRQGMLTVPTEEMHRVKVDGATIEFKMHDEDRGKGLLQALASIIRASYNLVVDALKVGKVIVLRCTDCLGWLDNLLWCMDAIGSKYE